MIKNKCVFALFALCFAVSVLPLCAQDDNDGMDTDNDGEDINSETPIQSNWLGEKYSLYTRGDKILSVNIGALFKLFVMDDDNKKTKDEIHTGGVLAFSFSYFLTPSLFVGGTLKGSFSPTEAKKILYLVPMEALVGYQFIWNRFEFPVSLGLGGVGHSYDLATYYGMFMEVEGGAYFRFNPDWSFGLSTALWWVPQWPKAWEDGKVYNRNAYFLQLTASARYHF
jgi:hypothetical protein